MTREFFFTVIPFGLLFMIFLIMTDWAGTNSRYTQTVIIHHALAPLRDGVREFFDNARLVTASVQSLVESGIWEDPYDASAFHAHIFSLVTQDSSSSLGRYFANTQITIDAVHGNSIRNRYPDSGIFIDTFADAKGIGIRGKTFNYSSATPGVCPVDANKVISVERNSVLPGLSRPTSSGTNGPEDWDWVTGISIFNNDVAALRFAVNWSTFKMVTSLSAANPTDSIRLPVSVFYLAYDRGSLDELVAVDSTTGIQVIAGIYNSATGVVLAFSLASELLYTVPWRSFNISDSTLAAYFKLPPNLPALSAANNFTAVLTGTFDVTSSIRMSQVTVSSLSSMLGAQGEDRGWRLLTWSNHTGWEGHASMRAKVNRFFGSQLKLTQTIRTAIVTRLVVNIDDHDALGSLIAPLIAPFDKLKAFVEDPFPLSQLSSAADPQGTQLLLIKRSPFVVDQYVYTMPTPNVATRSTSYTPTRSSIFSFDAMVGPVSVSTKVADLEEMKFLPEFTQASSLLWIPGIQGSASSMYFQDRLDYNKISLVFKANWPTLPSAECGAANTNSTASGISTSYFKVSFDAKRLMTYLGALSLWGDQTANIVIVDAAGRVISANTEDALQSSIQRLQDIKAFAPITSDRLQSQIQYFRGLACTHSTYLYTCVYEELNAGKIITVTQYRPEDDPNSVFYFGLIDAKEKWYIVVKFNGQRTTSLSLSTRYQYVELIVIVFVGLIMTVALSVYTVDKILTLKRHMKDPLGPDAENIDTNAWNTEIRDMQKAVAFLRDTYVHFRGYVPGGVHIRNADEVEYGARVGVPNSSQVGFTSPPRAGPAGPPPSRNSGFSDIGSGQRDTAVDYEMGAVNYGLRSNGAAATTAGTIPPPPTAAAASSPTTGPNSPALGRSYENLALQAALLKDQLTDNECFILSFHIVNVETEVAVHGVDAILPVHDRLCDLFLYEINRRQGEVIDVRLDRLTAFWITRKSPELAKLVHNRVFSAASSLAARFATDVKPWIGVATEVKVEVIITITYGPASFGALGTETNRSAVLCGQAIQESTKALVNLGKKLGAAVGHRGDVITLAEATAVNYTHRSQVDGHCALLPIFAPSIIALRSPATCPCAVVATEDAEPLRAGVEKFVSAMFADPAEALVPFNSLKQSICAAPGPTMGTGEWFVEWLARAHSAGQLLGVLSEASL
jgi:hypothetical protein